MALFQVKKVGKGRERENIKIIVPFRSNPTRNRKSKKNSKKKFKDLKNTIMASFSSQKKLEKDEKERK